MSRIVCQAPCPLCNGCGYQRLSKEQTAALDVKVARMRIIVSDWYSTCPHCFGEGFILSDNVKFVRFLESYHARSSTQETNTSTVG